MAQPENKESRLERRAKRKEDREHQIAFQRERFKKRERNKKIFNYSVLALVVIAIAYAVYVNWAASHQVGVQDSLAKCLSKKGAIMYGTDWCPHCQEQKRLFGDSFKYVTFVNCDLGIACTIAGVDSYPTWIFPDGTNATGVQTLDSLANRMGCT